MIDLRITNNELDSNPYWSQALDKIFPPLACDIALFDQNGYDLSELEKRYAAANLANISLHREHRTALKQDWLTQPEKIEGAVLNHSLLFERKAYTGAALQQLNEWAHSLPLVNKITSMRPKWGLDFSIDYVDREGNAFEVLHWEFDGFEFSSIQERKIKYQEKFAGIDWDDAGVQLLKKKDKWHHLSFFEQSNWKCSYFGIENEQFKQVIWE